MKWFFLMYMLFGMIAALVVDFENAVIILLFYILSVACLYGIKDEL